MRIFSQCGDAESKEHEAITQQKSGALNKRVNEPTNMNKLSAFYFTARNNCQLMNTVVGRVEQRRTISADSDSHNTWLCVTTSNADRENIYLPNISGGLPDKARKRLYCLSCWQPLAYITHYY